MKKALIPYELFKYLVVLSLFFYGCQPRPNKDAITMQQFQEIKTPCDEGGEPNLFISETGRLYFSWVEYLNDTTDVLKFSTLLQGAWTEPQTIASGSNWFVNWADFPSLVSYQDGGQSLAAHWLQKSANGTYDYDVHIAQSFDAGATWTPSFIIHRDQIAAEHGFVSLLPLDEKEIFATWLDGRNTKGVTYKAGDHEHLGAMTLRAAIFNKAGQIKEEVELDNRVCDCCQTAAVMTDQGIVVVYRDRSENEIRDISIVRQEHGIWTTPKTVFNDNWLIAGCPVNGPSIDAQGKNVVIAWFTMNAEKPQVNVAFSDDHGANFIDPVQIDDGNALGRVDVELISNREAIVSWLEQSKNGGAIKLALVNSSGKIGESVELTKSNVSRKSGFPRMVKKENKVIIAWTDVDSSTKVKTGWMDIPH